MIKTMCCLGSATLGVLLLSACGSTAPINVDKSVLSTGDSNALTSGGYWWTYTDHNTLTSSGHTGADVDPITNIDNGLVPVDDDAAHGKVIHASGHVPQAAPWTDVTAATWVDSYWQGLYSDALIAAYPAAGIGFGFQKNNKPYDAVQGKYIGFVFDMKTTGSTNDISVSVPIVGTDLPDSNYKDDFIKDCVYPSKQDGMTDAQSFQATYSAQSCFRNYRKLFTMADRAGDDVWRTYCVLWSELGPPNWGADATPPAVSKDSLKQALKVQWDMFQPAEGAATAAFDVKLDNVKMVTEETAADVAGCDAAQITASAAMIAP